MPRGLYTRSLDMLKKVAYVFLSHVLNLPMLSLLINSDLALCNELCNKHDSVSLGPTRACTRLLNILLQAVCQRGATRPPDQRCQLNPVAPLVWVLPAPLFYFIKWGHGLSAER